MHLTRRPRPIPACRPAGFCRTSTGAAAAAADPGPSCRYRRCTTRTTTTRARKAGRRRRRRRRPRPAETTIWTPRCRRPHQQAPPANANANDNDNDDADSESDGEEEFSAALPFGPHDAAYQLNSVKRKRSKSWRIKSIKRIIAHLWAKCGCMCAVMVISPKYYVHMLSSHGSFDQAVAYGIKLGRWLAEVKRMRRVPINLAETLRSVQAASAAKTDFLETFCDSVSGLLEVDVLDQLRDGRAQLDATTAEADDARLKAGLVTLLQEHLRTMGEQPDGAASGDDDAARDEAPMVD